MMVIPRRTCEDDELAGREEKKRTVQKKIFSIVLPALSASSRFTQLFETQELSWRP